MTSPNPESPVRTSGPDRLAAELAHRNDELAALDAIGRLAARAPTLDAFLAEACAAVEALTGSAGIAVYALEADSKAIGLLHLRGASAETAEQLARAPVEPPAVFTAPKQTADVVSPSSYPERFQPILRAHGVTALARVPLVVGTRTVGVLAVSFSGPSPAQAEAHLGFLRPVGALVAAVMVEGDLGRSHEELERTQAQLLQRERLAALGALSAAVAHEVRNPLGVIFNAVGMLRRHRAMDDEGRALVDIVAEEAERLNRIVADLLGFARPTAATLRPSALGTIVEEAVRAALAGAKTPIDVTWSLAADLPPVAVDAGLVRQALINVVLNAAQAMPRGGRLQVRTAVSAGWATIEVTDGGAGIPAELRARIFEPFFTTRTSGTGLGLAIVKHVVDVHGGTVDVAPAEGGGTRFALRFPLGGARSPAGPPPAAG